MLLRATVAAAHTSSFMFFFVLHIEIGATLTIFVLFRIIKLIESEQI